MFFYKGCAEQSVGMCKPIEQIPLIIMSETTQQFKKQLPKNAIMAVLQFATYTLSAIWLTPYLVKNLGAAAYGLVPLAGLFTQYVAIITAQLSGAVNRFLTIEINKPDGNPNVVFNSAFSLYLVLCLIQLPLFGVGLVYADKLLTIPPALKTDALLLLGCSSASFLVSLLGAAFGVSSFSKNRLDISSATNIGKLLSRLLLIILCFTVWGPKLRYIGYVDLGINLFMLGVVVRIWRMLTPELHINFRAVDIKLLGPIFKMSFWTLINQLGALLYLRTDIWIINRFISPVAAGQYAAILVVANFVRQVGSQFSNQLAPTIMSYWARQELAALKRLLIFMVKVLAFGLAIPVALICANGESILRLWLGEDFSSCSTLLLVMSIHLPINLAVLPMFTLQTASNSVKLPALVTFVMGVGNVILSYYLGVNLGMGAIGVALATGVMLSFKNAFFIPIYSAHTMKLPKFIFLPYIAFGMLMMGGLYLMSKLPVAGWVGLRVDSLFGLAVQSVFVAIVSAVVGWFVVLGRAEQQVLIGLVRGVTRAVFKLKP
jgi:membrane protein EpsK